MSEPFDQILTSYGPAGIAMLGLLIALKHVYRQLTESHDKRAEVQDKRIADAQATTTKLLEVMSSQHAHQALLAQAIDGNADAIRSLREMLEAPALAPAPERVVPVPAQRPPGLPRRGGG